MNKGELEFFTQGELDERPKWSEMSVYKNLAILWQDYFLESGKIFLESGKIYLEKARFLFRNRYGIDDTLFRKSCQTVHKEILPFH